MPTPALRPTFVWDQIGTKWFPITAAFAPETGISKTNKKPYWKITIEGNEKILVTRTKRGTAVPATDGERVTMWLEQKMFNLMQSLEIDSGVVFHIHQGANGYTLYFDNKEHEPSSVSPEPSDPAPPPEDKPEASTDWNDVPPIKEPGSSGVSSFDQIMKANVAVGVDIFKTHCGEAWEQADLVEKAQYLLKIMKIVAPAYSTQIINQEKNGGK